METTTLPASQLTKKQAKTFGPKFYTEDGRRYRIIAKVRYDDSCGNGHNTFSITAEIDRWSGTRFVEDGGGCCHDIIAKHFPELAPFIKWHLFDANGPMHYVANTLYHALEHGPTYAWVYYTGKRDPLGLGGNKEELVSYSAAQEVQKAVGVEGYRIKWDEKTAKVRNLKHARSSAVWPEATDEELTVSPDVLKAKLIERLPGLVLEFKAAVESLGFTY